MYMQEEEEESEMGVKEENEEECQGQAEARTVSSKEKNITRGEEEELRDEGVTGSREVLEDDVLTWWNEALASQDSVLTVLELPREGDEQVGGAMPQAAPPRVKGMKTAGQTPCRQDAQARATVA